MRFVDLAKYRFVLEPRYYFFGWSSSPKIIGNESAVRALVRARKFLPIGYNFKIWDMQRPLSVQLEMIKSFERRFKVLHPTWSQKQITEYVFKFAAKPLPKVTRIDTHRHGGAVDLTIIDKTGQELFMGTDHDDLTAKAATDYFRNLKRPNALEKIAKQNRNLLVNVMTRAGWENYSPEWWHWSYGQ